MKRLLLIAASAFALTACSGMNEFMKHDRTPYQELGKIAQQQDAQHALLFTREGKLVVVNVTTGEIVEPSEAGQRAEMRRQRVGDGTMAEDHRVSDEEFAEIKRNFDSTIKIEAIRGSVCKNIVKQPPGQQWTICSPPYPKWW